MTAAPLLRLILEAMKRHRLEAILIGNAGAAIHGAPVTTLDFDFMFRDTPVNMRKLKAVAKQLKAVVLRPYYPVSKFYRMVDDERGMPVVDGVKSFESLRSRAHRVEVENAPLLLASLGDIIKSKRSAGRARDLAVMEVLERTLNEQTNFSAEKNGAAPVASRRARRPQGRKRSSPH